MTAQDIAALAVAATTVIGSFIGSWSFSNARSRS